MKHTIVIGTFVLGVLGTWAGLAGCEITGAGIGLHDVEEGGECKDSDDCKAGSCYQNRCKSAPGGGPCEEVLCDVDAECCSGICANGICHDECGDLYASCDADSDCCSGFVCQGSICKEKGEGCTSSGGLCDFDSECCSGYCDGFGECASGSCGGAGDYCSYDSDCCSDFCSSSFECY